jgi:cyclopropane-fatty-acyl-phospholipid synthase
MNETMMSSPVEAAQAVRLGAVDRLLRRIVCRRLDRLRHGRITLIDPVGVLCFGRQTDICSLQVTVRVHHLQAYRQLATRGSIGVGEAYMAGGWSCEDLTGLMRIFAVNREALNSLEHGPVRLAMGLFRLTHALRRNSRSQARANIAAHYDLGNDFYRLFLDDTLMYSSGIFKTESSDLREASIAKNERICRKLSLCPDDHVLEIGTGWGGFALHAASRYGCRVTTVTISREQHTLALQRVREAGLAERVTVLLQDYREIEGRFDKLVSIEMIEAVGHRYFETYFQVCSRLLKPQGMMLIQAITIADQEYERYRRAVDFIQQYIFPGGCLPSVSAICASVTKATDLRLFHLEDIGAHYATTLRHWRTRFFANLDRVRAQGFSDTFIRMWEFYFCYCEGGFSERVIGTVQVLFTKPLCRREPLLPALD